MSRGLNKPLQKKKNQITTNHKANRIYLVFLYKNANVGCNILKHLTHKYFQRSMNFSNVYTRAIG